MPLITFALFQLRDPTLNDYRCALLNRPGFVIGLHFGSRFISFDDLDLFVHALKVKQKRRTVLQVLALGFLYLRVWASQIDAIRRKGEKDSAHSAL